MQDLYHQQYSVKKLEQAMATDDAEPKPKQQKVQGATSKHMVLLSEELEVCCRGPHLKMLLKP